MSDQNVSLVEFIRAARDKGADDAFVVNLLRSRGWSEKRILDAFAAFYEAETGVGVPFRGGRVEAARDAFLYLLSFIALGTWTWSLGSLFYSIIDLYFPPVNGLGHPLPTRSSVSMEMAGILVAFPLYLLVMRGIGKSGGVKPGTASFWRTQVADLHRAADRGRDSIGRCRGLSCLAAEGRFNAAIRITGDHAAGARRRSYALLPDDVARRGAAGPP